MSEESIHMLRVKMTQEEVKCLLGPPDQVQTRRKTKGWPLGLSDTWWTYHVASSAKGQIPVAIYFDATDRVAEVYCNYERIR